MIHEFNEILSSVDILSKEWITTSNAMTRIIAEPVKARASLPEFDIAAVDGYAIRCADLNVFPATLSIQGESSSAKPFNDMLLPGKAVRTYAGGKIANGADAVVALANTHNEGDMVVINTSSMLGENICYTGADFSPSDVAFDRGAVMNSRLIGLASAMKILWLPVIRKPRVAVLAVGSELAMPGEANDTNPITASSLYTLPAKITASGGEPSILGIASDSPEDVKQKIEELKNFDLLITTGATSFGAGDLMPKVLKSLSPEVHTLKIQLRRNDNMLFTRYNGMLICALPGNPISSSIYFSLFAHKIINKMVGVPDSKRYYAVLARSLDTHDNSVAYLHASLGTDPSGVTLVTPVSAQDGFLLTALAKSDCLLVVNENKHLKKGDMVEYIPLSHSLLST